MKRGKILLHASCQKSDQKTDFRHYVEKTELKIKRVPRLDLDDLKRAYLSLN